MKKRIFIISIALLLFLLAWKILFSGGTPDLQTPESLPTKTQATEVTEQDIAVDIVNEYAYLPLQYEVNAQGYYTHKAVKQAHLKRQKRVRSPYSLIQSFAPQLKIDRFFVEKSAQFINESYQSTTRATQLSTKQAKIRPFPAETELRTDALPFSVPIDEALQDKPQKQASLASPLASKGSKPKQTSEEQTAPLAQETKKESVTQVKAQDEAKVDRQEALKDEIKEVKEEVKEDETKAETKDGKQDNDNALLNGAANVAAAVGGLVYGGADLVSAATDVAVSTLGNELQRLLNKIATVNVQLNIDRNLAIKNSKLELLFPICDRENDITFLQTTLHQTDERNQGNIGLGYRFLTKEWMLGANAFLDYDFSHGHARAGVGGEYSRDFMRISVNRYIPLTGWKNSPDVLDYQERAAHGWDVRAKFWLPQLPQLGGKLIYEQYYGDEVALVSKKSRAKNPVAVTAGVTYTPFPLLEFSLDYKRSLTDDDDDTLFSVDVNYQLGVPWAQQIDPKTLNKVRSLMHSRYELVERNNNIVLEYRKQTLIIFKMAKTITAYEGNTRSLNVVQYAKYKPLAIALSGTDFITAGGKLDSANYTVTLPSYSTGGANTYVITGLATDAKKHQEYAYTTVIVKLKAARGEKSTFTPSESKILANNTDTQVLTLTVNDKNGDATDIPLEDIVIAKGGSYSSTVSSPNRTGTGTYEVTVKAGNKVEEVVLTPRVQGDNVTPATVSVTSMEPIHKDADGNVYSTFESSLESIIANDNQKSELKLTAKNEKGLAITGIKNLLSFEISKITRAATSSFTMSEITESAPGVYTADLKIAVPGNYKVIAKYRGKQVGELAVSILAEEQKADGTKSSFEIAPTTLFANNSDKLKVTITLKDALNIGITGQASKLTLGASSGTESNLVASTFEDKGNGVYEGTLKIKVGGAGSYTVIPKHDGTQIGSLSKSITASAQSIDNTNSAFDISPTTVLANNSDALKVTITLKDASSIGITGQASKLTLGASSGTESNLVASTFEDKGNGVYEGTLKIKVGGAGSYTVTPKYDGTQIGSLSKNITASAQSIDNTNSAFDISPTTVLANNSDKLKVTITLKDALNIGITGQASKLTLGASSGTESNLVASTFEDKGNGVYEGILKIKVGGAGSYTVIPKYDTNQIGSLSKDITAKTQTVNVANSSFTVSVDGVVGTNSIFADNTQKAKLSLELKDDSGVLMKPALSDISFKFETATTNATLSEKQTESDSSHYYYVTNVTASSAGTYKVIPYHGSEKIGTLSQSVTAKEQSAGTSSTFTAKTSKVVADNVNQETLTLVLKDSSNNAITNAANSLTTTITASGTGDASKSAVSVFTESTTAGTYTATFTTNVAGSYSIAPSYKGTVIKGASGNLSASITAEEQTAAPSPTSSITTPSGTIIANNVSTKTLTLILVDTKGNIITDKANLITTNITSTDGTPTKATVDSFIETSTKGTYTANFKTLIAGTYTIAAKFNGTAINNVTVSVTATEQQLGTSSTFEMNDSTTSILANDYDTKILTLVLKDKDGYAITGKESLIDTPTVTLVENGDLTKYTLTAFTESSTKGGTYTATFKTSAYGKYKVVPKFNGTVVSNASGELSVTIDTTKPEPTDFSVITSTTKTIVANNQYAAQVNVSFKDASGQPVATENTAFKFDGTVRSVDARFYGLFRENNNTLLFTYVYASTAGDYTIIPTYNDKQIGTKSITITATEPTISTTLSTISADPTSILANAVTKSKVTLKLMDTNKQLVLNQVAAGHLEFEVTSGTASNVKMGTINEISSGTYTVELTLKLGSTGSYTITPKFYGKLISGLSTTVSAQEPAVGTSSTFTAPEGSIIADNIASKTLTLKLKDGDDVAMSGKSSLITTVITASSGGDKDKSTISTFTESTSEPGTYTATFQTNAAGSYKIEPYYNNTVIKDTTGNVSVTITATEQTAAASPTSSITAVPSTIIADGETLTKLTLVLVDTEGKVITDKISLIKLDITRTDGQTTNASVDNLVESDTKGTYTASFTPPSAGTYTIAAKFNSQSITDVNTTVTATEQEIGTKSNSTFTMNDEGTSILANNYDTKTLTLVLKDKNNKVITGKASLIDTPTVTLVENGDLTKYTLNAFTESLTTKGTYTATFKTSAYGKYKVVPKFNGAVVNGTDGELSVTVETTEPVPTNNSTLERGDVAIEANDRDVRVVYITLKDASGQVITDAANTGFIFKGTVTKEQARFGYKGTDKGGIRVYRYMYAATKGVYTVIPTYKGEEFGSLSIDVTAVAPTISTTSTFIADPTSITANGVTTSTLTLTLKGKSNLLMPTQKNNLTFEVTSGTASNVVIGSITESSTGVYKATVALKLGSTGDYVITPKLYDTAINTLSATISAKEQAAGTSSTFTAPAGSIIADNIASKTLTLKLKDGSNVAMSGKSSLITTVITASSGGDKDKSTISSFTESTSEPGTYTATFQTNAAGSYKIEPYYNNTVIKDTTGNLSITITASEQTPGGSGKSTFTSEDKTIIANNSDTNTLTLTLQDTSGNAITGKQSLIGTNVTGSNGATATATVSSFVEDRTTKGKYTATFKTSVTDTFNIIPTFNTAEITGLSTSITTKDQTINLTNSTIEITEPTSKEILANLSDKVNFKFVIKDDSGVYILGTPYYIDNDYFVLSDYKKVTEGTYSGSIQTSKVGTNTITIQIKGSDGVLQKPGISVNFTAIEPTPDKDQSKFSLSKSSVVANDTEISTLTLELKDASGVALSGKESLLKFTTDKTEGATITDVKESATVKGTYTANFTASQVDSYDVIPKYNEDQIGKLSLTVKTTKPVISAKYSTIKVDKESYTLGQSIVVTITLKDSSDVAMKGQTSILTSTAVTVENASLNGNWVEGENGVYTANYDAIKAGSSLYAKFAWSDNDSISSESAYTISNSMVLPYNSDISCEQMKAYLNNNSEVIINSDNQNRVRNVCIPNNSRGNTDYRGKYVRIRSSASSTLATYITIYDADGNTSSNTSSNESNPNLNYYGAVNGTGVPPVEYTYWNLVN